MATAFDLQFAAAAVSLFAEFGEPVVYIPREGARKTITGVVTRQPRQPMPPVDNAVAPLLTVKVFTDPATEDYGGIDPARIDTGGDSFRLATIKGQAVEVRPITKIQRVNGGVAVLEVR